MDDKKKPKTFGEVFKNAQASQMRELGPDEVEVEFGQNLEPKEQEVHQPIGEDVPREGEGLEKATRDENTTFAELRRKSPWILIPEGLRLPKPGMQVGFLMFRADWTDTPKKGPRQCILWSLSLGDEKLARQAQRGDDSRYTSEHAKRMIRAVDGYVADWTGRGGPADVERFWSEIGHKCRNLIENYYLKTHSLTVQERLDFFSNCIVVATSS